MKLDPRFKIEKVCSRDTTRRAFCNPYLDVERKRIAATDGHKLAVVPATPDEGDRSGALPAPAVAASRKAKIKARKRLAVCGETMHVRPEVRFPDIDAVIPDYKPGDKGTLTIALNPQYLMELAQALGGGKRFQLAVLTIKLPEAGKAMLDPILVKLGVAEEAVGVLMPGRV